MSGNSGPLASTKGDSSSSTKSTTKSGFEHLDVNRLFKGKATEPVPKSVAQKHGMQSLGKVLPPRRAGNAANLKSESTPSPDNLTALSPGPPVLPNNNQLPGYSLSEAQQRQQELQQQQQAQGWNSSHPPPPGPHRIPNMAVNGPPHDKKWTGGVDPRGSYASHRFAQEFPSLDAAGEPHKGQAPNSGGPTSRLPNSKSQDNQYGPGPILRPQTEGNWTQGGGRRPSGPLSSNPASNYPPDRVNLGGPTPPPMSLGQGGPIPPPLGAFPMQFRGQMTNPSYMYPNSASGFYPGGPVQGMGYGMMPRGAPPPPGGLPVDGPRGGGRPPPPTRPGSHFANKPIIRAEEMERMDEIGTHEGGWASTSDDIDYNKKINFSDEEDGSAEPKRRAPPLTNNVEPKETEQRKGEDRENRPVRIMERDRPAPPQDRDREVDREAERLRGEPGPGPRQKEGAYEYENGDDWNRRRAYEIKERDRGGRRPRDDDWRSGGNRYDEDSRGKQGQPMGGRPEGRPSQDFQSQSSKYGGNSNVPPRFLKNQGHGGPTPFNQQPSNTRQTPSPVATSGKDRDQRDPREPPTYKILERRRGESESSQESRDSQRKRYTNSNDHDSRNERHSDHDFGKSTNSKYGPGDFGRNRGHEEPRKASAQSNSAPAEPKGAGEVKEEMNSKEEAKPAFRKRSELSTTSWAEEMDEDENELIMDSRKPAKETTPVQPKREEPKPKRYIISQTKVADMRTHAKVEPAPETKQKAPSPPKETVKPVEKPKPTEAPKSEAVEPSGEKTTDAKKVTGEKEAESKRGPKSPPAGRRQPNPWTANNHQGGQGQGQKGKGRDRKWDRDSREDVSNIRDGEQPGHNRDRDQAHNRDRDQAHNRDRDQASHNRDRDQAPHNRDRDQAPHNRDRDRNQPGYNRDRDQHPNNRDREQPAQNRDKDQPPHNRDRDNRDRDQPAHNRDKEQSAHNRDRDQPAHNRDRDRDQPAYNRDRDQAGHNRDRPAHNRDRDQPAHNRERDVNYKSTNQNAKVPIEQQQHKAEPSAEQKQKVPAQPPKEEAGSSDKSKPSSESGDKKEIGEVDEKGRKNGSERSSDYIYKRGGKAPAGPRQRNQRGGGGVGSGAGGSRGSLQGYGPPSDRKPFSNSKQDDEPVSKEKGSEPSAAPAKPTPPITSGPVPLMALGEISPPEMPPRSRHPNSYRDRDQRDPHGNSRAVPPRLQRGGRGENQSGRGKKKGGDGKPHTPRQNDSDRAEAQEEPKPPAESESSKKAVVEQAPAPPPTGNAWTKPITASLRSDLPLASSLASSTPPPEPKDPPKPQATSALGTGLPQTHSDKTMEISCPQKTIIFENTKLKGAAGKFSDGFNKGPNKAPDDPPLPPTIEKPMEIPLSYGKAPGGSAVSLDFGSSFENNSQPGHKAAVTLSQPAPSRPYASLSHQPSPISPMAADLNENIQAVRSLWDTPTISTGPDQSSVGGSEDSSLSSGFGGDTFKRSDASRDPGQSLQQSSIAFSSGNTVPVSVIAKPNSSSSPTSANLRQMKPVQQPSMMESQGHMSMPFSPFGYGMPQQHQGANAFGGLSAVPSPPAAMYGKPHTAPGPNPVYHAFQTPDNSHVMGGNNRSQYSAYQNVPPAGGPYGSLYLPYSQQIDNHYASFGHGGQGGGVGQGQSQSNNRISPSSMPMTSSSGIVVGGVMNSSGVNSFKSSGRNGTGSHPSLSHQVHHGPQQGYSQMGHHIQHPSHHMSGVGPQKGSYSQAGHTSQTQPQTMYIPYDQSVLGLGQNYMSSGGMRGGGVPPPSATPPMQGLPASGSYYGSNSNQGGAYPGGNSQQLHMTVSSGPQSLPGPNAHYGIQYQHQPQMNMQGYSTQGPGSGTVNLGNPMIRPGHPARK